MAWLGFASGVNSYADAYVVIYLGNDGLAVKNLPATQEDLGSIPGLGRFPGE